MSSYVASQVVASVIYLFPLTETQHGSRLKGGNCDVSSPKEYSRNPAYVYITHALPPVKPKRTRQVRNLGPHRVDVSVCTSLQHRVAGRNPGLSPFFYSFSARHKLKRRGRCGQSFGKRRLAASRKRKQIQAPGVSSPVGKLPLPRLFKKLNFSAPGSR